MPIVKMPDGVLVDMPDNPSPEEVAKLKQVLGTAEKSMYESGVEATKDIAKSAGSGVVKGAQGLANLFTGLIESYGKAAAPANEAMVKATTPSSRLPDPATLTGKLNASQGVDTLATAAGADYAPTTATGRYAKSIGEQVPGFAFGNVSLPLKAVGAVGAGVGAEGLNQVMGGDSQVGKLVGGVAGGLVAPGIAMKAKNAKEILAEALQGLDAGDFAKARGIKQTLTDAGLPHLNSQLFPMPTTLPATMARVAENPTQGPRLLRFLESVPEATDAAVSTRLAKLAPTGGGAEARDIAQETAEARLSQLGQQASKEYTDNMPARFRYDKQHIKDLYDNLLDLADDMGETSQAGQFIMRKAQGLKTKENNWITDSNAINQLYKELGAGFPDLGKLSSVEAQRVKEVFRAATPEFDEARRAFSTFKDDVVNPTKKSLTGQIATAGGGPQVDKVTRNEIINKLAFPVKDVQPAEIRKLAKDMRLAGNPQAFNGLVADYVSQAMQTAFKGGSINSPAKLADSIYGTSAQKVNLTVAIEEMAKNTGHKPALVSKGFKRFFEALETYKNLDIKQGVSGGQLAEEAGKTFTGGLLSPRFVWRRWLERGASDKTYKEISDIMMSPQGLDKLEELSKYSPYSRSAVLLMNDLVSGAAGTQTEPNSAPMQ